MSEEKRKSRRFECSVPIDGQAGSRFGSTATFDIGRGGVGLISRKELAVNDRIAVELAFAADEEPVLVVGTVRWVEKDGDTEQYRVGMQFEDHLSGERSRLEQYFT